MCDKYPQNQLNHDRDRSRPRRQNLPFSSTTGNDRIGTNCPGADTKKKSYIDHIDTYVDQDLHETTQLSPKSVIVREFEDKLVAEIDKCGSGSTFHSLRTMAERVQTQFPGKTLNYQHSDFQSLQ